MSLTRRDFVVGASAAALTAKTMAQGVTKPVPIVGEGNHVYEVHHDWLVPPRNLNWGDTHGVTTDNQGHIYIAHTVGEGSISKDAICVFDQKGKFVRSFGSEFAGGAHGLDHRKEGSQEFLYICDVNRKVVAKTELNGKVVWEFGIPADAEWNPAKAGWNPTNVAFLPNGDFLVGDGYGSSHILQFSADGEYRRTIINPGKEAGKVSCPHGLWVDQRDPKNPILVVADRSNNRLQNFTLDGEHIGFVTEGVRQPCHIHFNKDLMLIPDLASRVTILGKNNEAVAQLGDGFPTNLRGAKRSEFIPGKFVHPHGAAWINSRDIVVAEWVPNGRVTLLKKV